MRRLPTHHVPRPRLTDACVREHLVVVEAPGGYGKSVFGVELVDVWRAVGIEVQLEHANMPAPLLASRIQAAVQRAGFVEAAAAALDAGADHAGAVDAMIASLAAERCAFVFDDAHNAGPDAGALIDHIATTLEGEQRLVVLARQLPEGAERLRRAEFMHLSSGDLALRSEETLKICRTGFGLDVGDAEIAVLGRATGGWTAAAVLAAARASRTGEAIETVAAAAAGPDHPGGALAAILEEAMVALGPAARPLLAQVARLPVLDAEVVDAAVAEPGFYERALAKGLPFTPARAPWLELPGPVRDYLATLAPVQPEALVRAAKAFEERGEVGPALQLLLASGQPGEAAALLAATPFEMIEAIDILELRAVFDQLPAEEVDGNPDVLLVLARACDAGTLFELRSELLVRARALAAATGDERLARAVESEDTNDLIRALDYEEAEGRARGLLAAAPADEVLTRARASSALGRALCWKLDGDGRRDEAALLEAEQHLKHAMTLYRSLGMRSAVAGAAPVLAIWIEWARGSAEAAVERLMAAAAESFDRPRRRAYVLYFSIEVLAELGRHDECDTVAEEVFRIADQLDNKQMRAFAHWFLASSTSFREDVDATLDHLRQAEANRDVWWNHAGSEFLASAADLCDRVGEVALARDYLERARPAPADAEAAIILAEAALEARHGDPARADELLAAAASSPIEPREYWRVTLLQAYAAFRRGEHWAAGALAARAFEEAARLGQPALPLIRERAVTEQLIALAAETGQPAAVALEAGALPTALAVLGRFELTVGGRPVALPAGQGAQLLKLLAVGGGRLNADQAIESVWPDVAPDAGRNRLRTVLNRLRSTGGDLVAREGNMLVLDPAVKVDLDEFNAEARRAKALGGAEPSLAAAVARGAIARYRGDLLPDDRYEEWAEGPRDDARRTLLDLLDLCAGDAARRGNLDEARRIVEQTIELAPHDETRYLRAATAQLDQGRRGEALALVERARAAFGEIGLDPPAPLVQLERTILA